ncbi:hypothetical protein CSC17_2103 [Klebsiella oxytoca]|jgi:hypothetical protein|nr:hypothetical protein CSC17_2103 [Klebsiella oxytoca]
MLGFYTGVARLSVFKGSAARYFPEAALDAPCPGYQVRRRL